jgi:type I restriction enzyme, S subunit
MALGADRVTGTSNDGVNSADLRGRAVRGDMPFVTPAELAGTEPIMSTPRTLSPAGAARAQVLPTGTVLVCCIGSLGKVGIAGRPLTTNQQINSVTFNEERVWPRFGVHACRLLEPRLASLAPATTVPIVSKSRFETLEIPLPPLPEQRRIADILDRADALRAKRRAALAQLDTLNQSIFLDLFGKGGKFGSVCESLPLNRVCMTVVDGVHKTPVYRTAGVPFVTVRNIVTGRLDLSNTKLISEDDHKSFTKRTGPQRGDVLVSKDGTIGVPCAVRSDDEFSIFVSVALLKPRPELIDQMFLVAQIRTELVQRQIRANSKGIAIRHLHLEDFKRLRLLVPPLPAQQEFARLSAATSQAGGLQQAALNELDSLFGSLQHRAFQGTRR